MRALALVLVVGISVGGCVACSSTHPDFCGPPPLTLAPAHAGPGQKVELAAAAGDCGAGRGRTYQVAVTGSGGTVTVGSVTPEPTGAFVLDFTVPSLAPGEYDVVVRGSSLDSCTDPDSSCAAYSTVLKVTS